jgi:hypothetical protein
MGLSQDLLDLADHLSRRERRKPKQASLRRAVSTAYYALFHLLIEDATKRWSGHKNSRIGLARAFEHSNMDRASKAFQRRNWEGFDGKDILIPQDLRNVARVCSGREEPVPIWIISREQSRNALNTFLADR